jgi:histone-lysine N-methyltransferase SETD3
MAEFNETTPNPLEERPVGIADRDKFLEEDEERDDAIDTSDDKFTVFNQWLIDNGTRFPDLEMRKYSSEVRGVHAKAAIQPEQIILEIPLKCLITVEMGQATHIGRILMTQSIPLDAPKHIYLMLFMLIDRKREDSFFKPYYDILPATLSNMPIFWTDEELGYLTGSYVLEQVAERRAAILRDYETICRVCPDFTSIATHDEFAWARMCVCSRNFGIDVNGRKTAAMVPYADMLNHYRPRETRWEFDNSRMAFTITSTMDISVGAQVYDSYGSKCNHRFLLNYGFSIENNEESDGSNPNEVCFLLQFDRNDKLFHAKLASYRREGIYSEKRFRISRADENVTNVLGFLRAVCSSSEDIDDYQGSNYSYSQRHLFLPINFDNEVRALKRFRAEMIRNLKQYDHSLAYDLELLRGGELKPFSNHRHAVIQTKSEKEVFHYYIRFCDVCLAFLALSGEGSNNNDSTVQEGEGQDGKEDEEEKAGGEENVSDVPPLSHSTDLFKEYYEQEKQVFEAGEENEEGEVTTPFQYPQWDDSDQTLEDIVSRIYEYEDYFVAEFVLSYLKGLVEDRREDRERREEEDRLKRREDASPLDGSQGGMDLSKPTIV